MDNIITFEKIEKYFNLTNKALNEIKKNIIKGKENQAREIIDMVTNYLYDAKHFLDKRDYVNCFAALNYSHGWIDSGVRLKIFDVHDDQLFTVC
ncbi:MAG: DUF357 domain-containing protein [Candidatus Pacearchaeota archaeon]